MFCCSDSKKFIFYLKGPNRLKSEFLKRTFSIDSATKPYAEYASELNNKKFVFRVCDESIITNDIEATHIDLCSAIIFLSTKDITISFEKPTLFILVGNKTSQTSGEKFFAASAVEDYHEAKIELKNLLDLLDCKKEI